MHMLDKIIAHKRQQVEQRKALYPVALLEKSIFFETPVVSLSAYLRRQDRLGIIAEFKRRSPSKGIINAYADVEQVTIGYMQAGASALSVLTDEHFFGGQNDDLSIARRFNYCPILRKDFIISEYQIVEARSIGADAILLIAAALQPGDTRRLAAFARSLGLEVLLELHGASELSHLNGHINAVGINNRNLADFSVNTQTSLEMLPHLPKEMVKVSESGLQDPARVADLKLAGYNGFLIGEHFMKSPRPELACREFIMRLKSHLNQLVSSHSNV